MDSRKQKYVLTNHLQERFLQRTNKKYEHVQYCRNKYCKQCEILLNEIAEITNDQREEITNEIYNRLDLAQDERSFLNNSNFMNWYYNKYGYDKGFEFLIHEDLLFIVIVERGRKIVVTCVLSKTHIAGKIHLSKKKFNPETNKRKFNKRFVKKSKLNSNKKQLSYLRDEIYETNV